MIGSYSTSTIVPSVHLHGLYLPVPVAARFRYPRFVGTSGNVLIHCVAHDSGREGAAWLDRQNHRFFGEVLREILEWEEAGRRLHVHWHPEAVVVRRGEVDQEVFEEEARHVEPRVLQELRLGRGESYRQSLGVILRDHPDGLGFRALCEELADRQGHRPSRGTIRAVLQQSPEFTIRDTRWCWGILRAPLGFSGGV
jgi:hypothetical protein